MRATSVVTFGDVLRRFRLEAGLTQDELARRANLSLRAISDLERGARNRPWWDTVQRLATALRLDSVERNQFAAAARPPVAPSSVGVRADQALREFPLVRHNLVTPLTSFVGRERETVELKELLASTRHLTLTGIGGIGKTRLATRVARDVLDSFSDGVWLIDLAPLADADLLPSAIATTLAIRDEAGQPTFSALLSALRSRQVLLVLDNCDHLINACADFAQTLLQSCPDVTILATSRE